MITSPQALTNGNRYRRVTVSLPLNNGSFQPRLINLVRSTDRQVDLVQCRIKISKLLIPVNSALICVRNALRLG